MIVRITRIRFCPGKEVEGRLVFAARSRELRDEPGCHGAQFLLSPAHPGEAVALSWWSDLASQTAHEASEGYRRFAGLAAAGGYLMAAPDIRWYEPVQDGELDGS